MLLQLAPGEGFLDSSFLTLMLFYLPFLFFILYGQRFQTRMILIEVGRSLARLKLMKERARKETLDYLSPLSDQGLNPAEKVDEFLEYFTIMPVDLDPNGIVRKIEHIITSKDERIKEEIRRLAPRANKAQASIIENIVEAATALNFIYKIVRHFYLLGKRTSSLYVIIQLQMLMPVIMQEADALLHAIDAFKKSQPIGDGIGPLVAGKMMLGLEKRPIAKETLLSETSYKGRRLFLIKAEGPGGNVGQPGKAVERLIDEMKIPINTIVMIDAALKLEGERTGEVAEGIGAAIGGIGVDRFKIEEVATKYNIPLYAVVIKQSIVDAITVMRKEIAEAADKVINSVKKIIEEKTREGDSILIVGVGNTLGISQ